ncbi:hypothetical protein [Albibacterium sp.]|uniref:hypothetical protein n=1 Tax=Albibacterium sp. TaxID=2952885 RepID=UPI002B720A6F|nr:hypothetical protein [Albibacterium sp.]HUH18037.1 hypothetical protein [Albibacterium sp.]
MRSNLKEGKKLNDKVDSFLCLFKIIKNFKLLIISATCFFLVSCETKEKISCDMPDGINLLKDGITYNYVEKLALKLAIDDYDGNKFNWLDEYRSDFKAYLTEQTRMIMADESIFYAFATENIEVDFLSFRHIITNSFDKVTNKCSCTATINYADSSPSSQVEYTLVFDNEGYLHTEYMDPVNIVMDTKNNVFNENFISNLLKEIKTERKRRLAK